MNAYQEYLEAAKKAQEDNINNIYNANKKTYEDQMNLVEEAKKKNLSEAYSDYMKQKQNMPAYLQRAGIYGTGQAESSNIAMASDYNKRRNDIRLSADESYRNLLNNIANLDNQRAADLATANANYNTQLADYNYRLQEAEKQAEAEKAIAAQNMQHELELARQKAQIELELAKQKAQIQAEQAQNTTSNELDHSLWIDGLKIMEDNPRLPSNDKIDYYLNHKEETYYYLDKFLDIYKKSPATWMELMDELMRRKILRADDLANYMDKYDLW